MHNPFKINTHYMSSWLSAVVDAIMSNNNRESRANRESRGGPPRHRKPTIDSISKERHSLPDAPPSSLTVPIEIHDIVSKFLGELNSRLIDLQDKLRQSEQKRRQVQYSTCNPRAWHSGCLFKAIRMETLRESWNMSVLSFRTIFLSFLNFRSRIPDFH